MTTDELWRPEDLGVAEPDPPRWSEAMILHLLREKYTRVRPGTNADRFVRAAHVRYPARGYCGDAVRIADYLVIDTYGGSEILGFEVKVSRADWLAELRDPQKAEAWGQHCHRWYLAVPDPSIVRDDLPPGWGMMALNRDGKLTIRRQAKRNPATPMPLRVLASLGRSIAQTSAREAPR